MQQVVFSYKYAPLFPPSDPATLGFAAEEPSISTRYVLISGGRGSGKSYAVSYALSHYLSRVGYKILYTRFTMASARDSIVDEFREKLEITGTERICRIVKSPNCEITNTVSGSQILFRGIKTGQGTQTAKLKSLQGINAWVLDEAEEMPDEDTFNKIDLSIRDPRRPNLVVLVFNPAHKRHWIYRRWWEPNDIPDTGFNGVAGDATFISTDYRDNVALAKSNPKYASMAERCKLVNWRMYQHVWLGGWLSEIDGALWSYEMIHDHRLTKGDSSIPEFRRVIVAVDPSVTGNPTSDECGIIVGASGIVDGVMNYYILADHSGVYTPKAWARLAIAEYRRNRASRIVAEVNHGGDLVEDTLRNVDRAIAFTAVHASRGKYIRAEPIAALYEMGLVHHVGTFRELETEQMSYIGPDDNYSPNRLDALVWCLSELAGIDPNVVTAEDVLSRTTEKDW